MNDTAPGFVPSRNGRFTDNLVLFRSDELAQTVNIGPNTAPQTFQFARNWWYCLDQPARSRPSLPSAESGGTTGRPKGVVHTHAALASQVESASHGAVGALKGPPSADPGPEATRFLYPYDRTVMPRGLIAPLLQVSPGSLPPEDVEVKLAGTHFSWHGYYHLANPAPPV